MDSDDSQSDIFATQVIKKKTKLQTSSAPVLKSKPKTSVFEYCWLIIFKWGDADYPFELVSISDLEDKDFEKTWLTGILSPMSRKKYQDIGIYPDFSISVFAKVEKSEYNNLYMLVA